MDIIQQLELLAEKLDNLCNEIVIVDGCTPALILDINTAPDLRPTNDVDFIIKASNYGKYNNFIEKIKEKGFIEREGYPIKKIVSDNNYPYFLSGLLRGDEASQAFLPNLRELIEKIASFNY